MTLNIFFYFSQGFFSGFLFSICIQILTKMSFLKPLGTFKTIVLAYHALWLSIAHIRQAFLVFYTNNSVILVNQILRAIPKKVHNVVIENLH